MMCRFLLNWFVVFVSTTSAMSQNGSAAQVLDRFRAKIEEYAALEIYFSLSGSDLSPMEGHIYREGVNYAMLNPEVEIYVCGDTKWIYTVGIHEAIVMRHDPGSVDLIENPLALFYGYLSNEYTLSEKPNYYVLDGREVTEIELTPKGKYVPYASILLRIHRQSLVPHSVKYIAKDGSWFEAVIINYIPKKQTFPPELFIFSEKKHPGVFVTDLR